MFPVIALLLPLAGGLLALGSHAAFLFALRAAHPGLYRRYWLIALRYARTHIQSHLLNHQVFARITDPLTLRFRRADVFCFRLFAGSLVVAVLGFALPLFLEFR